MNVFIQVQYLNQLFCCLFGNNFYLILKETYSHFLPNESAGGKTFRIYSKEPWKFISCLKFSNINLRIFTGLDHKLFGGLNKIHVFNTNLEIFWSISSCISDFGAGEEEDCLQ